MILLQEEYDIEYILNNQYVPSKTYIILRSLYNLKSI